MAKKEDEKPEKSQALTPVQKKMVSIRDSLDLALPQIAKALPALGITPESIARVAFTAISRNDKLLAADVRTLVRCVIEASQLGLSLDHNLGQAYLVPFNRKDSDTPEVQLMPGYKGYIALADRSGLVKDIVVGAVFAKDEFSHEVGLERDTLVHKMKTPEAERTPDNLTHTYAIFRLVNGGVRYRVLDRGEILKTRARSSGFKAMGESSPWGSDFIEMALKTAIRRAAKLVTLSPNLQRLLELDEKAEIGEPQDLAGAIFGDDADPLAKAQKEREKRNPSATEALEEELVGEIVE
jgi:recombination protein RecT